MKVCVVERWIFKPSSLSLAGDFSSGTFERKYCKVWASLEQARSVFEFPSHIEVTEEELSDGTVIVEWRWK